MKFTALYLENWGGDEDEASEKYSSYRNWPEVDKEFGNEYGYDLSKYRELVPVGCYLTSSGTIARGMDGVDASIYGFIERLNRVGFVTHQSDSGLKADHPYLVDHSPNQSLPSYVVFNPQTPVVQMVARRLGLRTVVKSSYGEPDCIWVYFSGGTDGELLNAWGTFVEAVVGYS